jgi:carboxylate-amine ligase
MDGSFIDFAAGEEVPARAVLERTAEWAGVDLAFPDRNGAQRQRALLEGGMSLREVYASTVEETQSTYGRADTP